MLVTRVGAELHAQTLEVNTADYRHAPGPDPDAYRVNPDTQDPPVIHSGVVCCLLFYVLATSKVISGWAPSYDSETYKAAPLENQVTSTMT